MHLTRVHGKGYAEIDNVVFAIIIEFNIRKSVFISKCFFAKVFLYKLLAKVFRHGLGFYRKVHIPMSEFAVVLMADEANWPLSTPITKISPLISKMCLIVSKNSMA